MDGLKFLPVVEIPPYHFSSGRPLKSARQRMSGIGTKRTSRHAFGGKADIGAAIATL